VAARLGHADPAVTLRVYSHVLREHALGIGDVFARAVKVPVSKLSPEKLGPSSLGVRPPRSQDPYRVRSARSSMAQGPFPALKQLFG
jgi:hypothetical protein